MNAKEKVSLLFCFAIIIAIAISDRSIGQEQIGVQTQNIATTTNTNSITTAKKPADSEVDALGELLAKDLPLLGHRNWVIVVDSAYPLQTAPGIKTIYVGGDQLESVQKALEAIEAANHVQPEVFVDKELQFVPEKYAEGIGEFKDKLDSLLSNRKVEKLEHEKIIAMLDEAGKSYRILAIKTDLTLPYTSVFFRLQAGYWPAEAEQALRDAIRNPEE